MNDNNNNDVEDDSSTDFAYRDAGIIRHNLDYHYGR